MKYSWFTVALPERNPADTAALLKQYGYDGVEWRVTEDTGSQEKPGFWSGNRSTLQSTWTDAQFKAVAEMTAAAGLAVPSLAAYIKCGDLALTERIMKVAKIFGSPCIRVGQPGYDGTRHYHEMLAEGQKFLAQVETLAKKHLVKALIEIHPGTITVSASSAYRLVSPFSPDYIGVIYDIGNMVGEGYENYQLGTEMLGAYLAHVHVKTYGWKSTETADLQKRKWETYGTVFSEGLVDFPKLFSALKKAGYKGWMSIEDFNTGLASEKKVREDIKFLKEAEKSA
jgi:sugar phosphate isomerase/epimerase